MNEKFQQLPLKKALLDNLETLGFATMTPIQAKSLPILLEGQDVIAQAKTGSGKTAAFGLRILDRLNVKKWETQALVLAPTRELAEQITKEIRRLARTMANIKVLNLSGGVAEVHQKRSLEHGVHIVIGTPGRLLSLIDKGALSLRSIGIFVLDEADRMLDMGFNEDIMKIESQLPKKRQTLLFSATYPREIGELSQSIQNSAVTVKVDTDHSSSSIEQCFYEVSADREKNEALLRVLGNHQPERVIVFCRMKSTTDKVASFLVKSGVFAGCIHGDLEQNERTAVLTKFSNRSLSVLVATDVAARGIDIKELESVVNYDLPSDPEVYTHRIGRTGRAGKEGSAYSLICPGEKFRIELFEQKTKQRIKVEKINQLSPGKKYELIPPMSTMFISGGKRDKLRPGDIVGALVGEAKLKPDDVGDISIFNILSYVAIKTSAIKQAVDSLSDGKIKNRKFKVGSA
ncbi:ATP-dependent RNA helicase DbpA [Bdellovibrionales bacterium]|nr:ATP-dependent RNA helicase DbpA [Bdellovibrionales bacterium]